jgi:hypothetical protein
VSRLKNKKSKKKALDIEATIGKTMSEYLDKYSASTSSTTASGATYNTVTLNEYGTATTGSLSLPTSTITAADVYSSVSKLRSYTSPNLPTEPELPTRDEQVAELASRIENLIADFLPDEHKDIPVKIAHAVAEELVTKEVDVAGYKAAESRLASKVANMTMEEYQRFRTEKLGML